jgi:hypothetical protein
MTSIDDPRFEEISWLLDEKPNVAIAQFLRAIIEGGSVLDVNNRITPGGYFVETKIYIQKDGKNYRAFFQSSGNTIDIYSFQFSRL